MTVIPKDTEGFEPVEVLGVRISSVNVRGSVSCKGMIICIVICGTETWISVDIQGCRQWINSGNQKRDLRL